MRRQTLVILVCTLALSTYALHQRAAHNKRGIVVNRVIDGDTVVVQLGNRSEHVRLIGIDTPETHGKGGLRECYGQEATADTKRLLPPGTKLHLTRDREERDKYGRLLAYVYRAQDNTFINLELVKDGSATTLSIAPNTFHQSDFANALAQAKTNNLGLWRQCGSADVALN